MVFPSVRQKIVGLFFLLALAGGGVTNPPAAATEAAQDPARIVVSILPQAWFAKKIGGRDVQVSVLVGPGQSPATYDPSARQMVQLQEAELFLFAGVPFEKGLLPRILRLPSGPAMTGVPVSHAGDETRIESITAEPDPGQDSGRHDHDGLDPHTWLDPRQAQVLADTMCAALCRLRPESRTQFLSHRDKLRADLEELDGELRETLSSHRGKEFFVFHPAFGHFAEAYGLIQIPIEAGGHEPGARHLAEVIDHARQTGASAIIVQPQFSRKSAASVAKSLGVEVIALDPLARQYDVNLREIANKLDDLFSRPEQHVERKQ